MQKNTFAASCAAIFLLMTSGCLSLGGTTTYNQDDPETKSRLDTLEARVQSLEQRLLPAPAYRQ